MEISEEADIHNEALRELGESLQAEVSPLVVDIEGQTVELSGSIEEQYQKWRKLLHEIYINETGFAINDVADDITDDIDVAEDIADDITDDIDVAEDVAEDNDSIDL